MAKSGGTPLYSVACYRLVAAIPCLLLIPFVPLPAAESWFFIILSVVIHSAYYFSLAKSYQHGDLSQMYPLFRGLAPVLVALAAAIFAGELLSWSALLGVILISAALVSLAVFGGGMSDRNKTAIKWGLLTSVLIASYTVADGMGVRTVETSLVYIIWLFLLEPVPVGLWLVATDRNGWFAYMLAKPGKIIAGGIAAALAYGLVIHAMSLGPMALVSSLRETSVIFAAIIGALLFREPFGIRRVVAACVICVGVVIVKLAG